MVFLSLSQTYGWTTLPDDLSKWPYRTLDFTEKYGLKNLSPKSLDAFRVKLQADHNLLFEYLTLKVGFDPNDKKEYAMSKYLHMDYVRLI